MLIYLVRHGETEANEKGLFQGWSDGALNQNGVKLAEITGRKMKGIHFDYCISSPLLRARKTVEIILKESGNDIPIQFDERIKEINIGEDECKPIGEGILSAEEARKFLTDPFDFVGFPGGENIKDVCSRTQEFLKELINKDDGKTYLIGIHGGALRAMLNPLYDDPSDFWHGHLPYNCSVNIIESKHGRMKLVADDKVYYDQSMVVDRYKS